MNDDLIRRFCESRYRWPIVAGATLLLGLAVLLPAVDDYFDKRSSCSTLADDLVLANQTAADLPQFETRVAEFTARLAELEHRAVGNEQVGEYRNQIVELARQSGCQVRRIEVSSPVSRAWRENDRAIVPDGETLKPGKKTPFALERRSMVLSIDGTMANIHQLLESIQEQNSLAHPHRLELRSSSRNGTTISLELELWLFSLDRQPA